MVSLVLIDRIVLRLV